MRQQDWWPGQQHAVATVHRNIAVMTGNKQHKQHKARTSAASSGVVLSAASVAAEPLVALALALPLPLPRPAGCLRQDASIATRVQDSQLHPAQHTHLLATPATQDRYVPTLLPVLLDAHERQQRRNHSQGQQCDGYIGGHTASWLVRRRRLCCGLQVGASGGCRLGRCTQVCRQ